MFSLGYKQQLYQKIMLQVEADDTKLNDCKVKRVGNMLESFQNLSFSLGIPTRVQMIKNNPQVFFKFITNIIKPCYIKSYFLRQNQMNPFANAFCLKF